VVSLGRKNTRTNQRSNRTITKQQELNLINEQLNDLMQKGCNDEKLVTRKRQLEKLLRL